MITVTEQQFQHYNSFSALSFENNSFSSVDSAAVRSRKKSGAKKSSATTATTVPTGNRRSDPLDNVVAVDSPKARVLLATKVVATKTVGLFSAPVTVAKTPVIAAAPVSSLTPSSVKASVASPPVARSAAHAAKYESPFSETAVNMSHSANYPIVPPAFVKEHTNDHLEEAPIFVLVTTYLGYLVLILFGHIRDFFGGILKRGEYKHLKHADGYAPLTSDFESFYTRRLYTRIRDCWNRPITGVPGRTITLLERKTDDYNKSYQFTGKTREVINFSSYNYLGFAQNEGLCADEVEQVLKTEHTAVCSSRSEVGTLSIHVKLEKLVARFLGKEDSMVISMGFATNSTTLPALVEKGCLIVSDELNHSSLVFGARLSGADIRIFKHNDASALETVLKEAISEGQPRTHRPWKKILVVVEGLYSMEGSICKLPQIVALKSKYKFYLYVDEAHSIGALGPRGGGVCDYYGIDPASVDILMGTFTKSFGAAGGYIASSREIISHLRLRNHGSIYAEAMSPPVAEQVYASMKIILGEDGTQDGKNRLLQIAENAVFFRRRLQELGFIVYGHEDSPVIPLLLFNPAKIPAFSRECLARGLAVVVVGYPATPIITSRARFCMSAAHSRQDLEDALVHISQVGDILQLKHSKRR